MLLVREHHLPNVTLYPRGQQSTNNGHPIFWIKFHFKGKFSAKNRLKSDVLCDCHLLVRFLSPPIRESAYNASWTRFCGQHFFSENGAQFCSYLVKRFCLGVALCGRKDFVQITVQKELVVEWAIMSAECKSGKTHRSIFSDLPGPGTSPARSTAGIFNQKDLYSSFSMKMELNCVYIWSIDFFLVKDKLPGRNLINVQ